MDLNLTKMFNVLQFSQVSLLLDYSYKGQIFKVYTFLNIFLCKLNVERFLLLLI